MCFFSGTPAPARVSLHVPLTDQHQWRSGNPRWRPLEQHFLPERRIAAAIVVGAILRGIMPLSERAELLQL